MKKRLVGFILTLTVSAFAQSNKNVLRVDSVSTNTGTIFGLRLNENNALNSKAPDAEIECNRPDSLFLIGYCEDGFCDTTDFDGNIFYNFYAHNERECHDTQKKIKTIIKSGYSACIKNLGYFLEIKSINKSANCF